MKKIEINSYGSKLEVILVKEHYQADNSTAIELMCNEDGYWEPYSTLTVCIPGAILEDNEILVKTWSENEPLKELATTDLFTDTGKRVKSGFVEAEIWRVEDTSILVTSEEFGQILSGGKL